MFYKDVSVIVTAYNVEDQIEDCLDSIIKQTASDLQVIVVDDGSDDLTPEIVDFWAEKYPELIKCIHCGHSGVGAARNVGLDNARGKYIAFVDGDDVIHANMYKDMLKIAREENADIVICDVLLDEKNIGGRRTVQHSVNDGVYEKHNYMRTGVNLCSPCNKLFRKKLFEGRRFENMAYEDMALIPAIVSDADKLAFSDKHYYYYIRRENSLTTGEFRIDDLWKAVTVSISGVNEEYREDMACWQARSLIDLANGEQTEYKDELEALVRNNIELFSGNRLIEKDPKVSKILKAELCQKANCAEVPEFSLTVVSELDKALIAEHILKNIGEPVQCITPKEIENGELIKGKFILCTDKYVKLPKDYTSKLETISEFCGDSTYAFATPVKTVNENNQEIGLIKKPELLNENDYVFAVSAKAFSEQSIAVGFHKHELLYYALMKKATVHFLNDTPTPYINELNVEPEDCDEIFRQDKCLLEDLSASVHCGKAMLAKLPPYIQHYVMSNLRKLIEKDYPDEIVSRDDFAEYKEGIRFVLENTDDDVIKSMKRVTPEHMLFFYKLKYQKEAELVEKANGLNLKYNSKCVYIQDNTYTMFEFCCFDNGVLQLEGRTICLNIEEDEKLNIFAFANGKVYAAEQLPRKCNRYCLGELLYKGVEFRFSIPIDPEESLYQLKFFYNYRGHRVARRDIRFGKFFPLSKRYGTSYYQKGNRLLTYNDGEKALEFRLWGRKGRLLKEKAFLEELKEKFPPEEYREIAQLRRRCLVQDMLPTNKQRVWLVSDKMSRADDNGEAFFKYLNSTPELKKKIKSYYLMDKSSSDYPRMKKYGRIVQFNSFKHKLLSLTCEYHFIAYANDAVTKPLNNYTDCFKDIMCREWIVFLQHGPTQNNVSSALNKYNQNFAAIVTINQKEHDSFLTYDYFYRDDQIKLTGFPRYDYLTDENEKYITFAPTWRRNLFGRFINQEERYELKDGFKDSDYFKFFEGVINNPKLKEAVKRDGYKLHVIPHPVFFPYMDQFNLGDEVIVHGAEVSYNQMFKKSSMFITDYSSAVFDCAYLEKPVLYTQFDSEDFYKNQYERGMFDYESEGFGAVTSTVEETVDAIVNCLDANCEMTQNYRERVNEYFKYHDKGNCERIFNEFY